VEVRAPQGMTIVKTNVPMSVSGASAVWKGMPSRTLALEIQFRPSLALRIWRGIVHFFNNPVIHV